MSILECAECGRTVDVMDIGVKAAIVKKKGLAILGFLFEIGKGNYL